MKLFGIPYTLWGIAALVITVIWVFIWPRKKSVRPKSLPYFILRWFHALTWLLLAAAAFIAGLDILGGQATALLVAFLGFFTYLVFMATVVITK
jgi:hypothetical protein